MKSKIRRLIIYFFCLIVITGLILPPLISSRIISGWALTLILFLIFGAFLELTRRLHKLMCTDKEKRSKS